MFLLRFVSSQKFGEEVGCERINTFEKVARKILALFERGFHKILDQFNN
jgi:hypothetical protein